MSLCITDEASACGALSLRLPAIGLFLGDAQIGTISSGPVANRPKDMTVDLPDELPHEVQVFLLLLLVRKWSDTSYT